MTDTHVFHNFISCQNIIKKELKVLKTYLFKLNKFIISALWTIEHCIFYFIFSQEFQIVILWYGRILLI